MEQQQELKSSWWQWIFPPALLSIITSIVYYPSLSYDFQFDDIANITKHFQIRQNSFSKLFLTGSRWISYWINSLHYQIGKFNPFSYRVGNVAIHTANGLFLFFILFWIFSKLPKKSFYTRNGFAISFLTALLFLLHPVQTQTVSYVIQGQLEGLAAFFGLLLTLTFLAINYSKKIWIKITGTLFFFATAFFATGSKEIVIVTPLLILLVDWFFIARGSLSLIKKKAWFHAINIVIIFSSYLYFLQPKFFLDLFGLKMEVGNNLGNIITNRHDQMITPLHFFISQFKVILHYLWIFIWPAHISVEYDWVLCSSFFAPDCFFPFLTLLSFAFLLYKLLKINSTSIVGFGALWFAINIAPRSSIIPSPELLVDYKTYLASVGWLLIISISIIWCHDKLKWYFPTFRQISNKSRFSYLFVCALACLLGFNTIERNKVWKSGLDFWQNIVQNAPGKARAYNNYGVELSQKLGKFAESIPYFEYAIKLDKNYRDPYNNLAVAQAATHQLDRAIETLRTSLKLNPYYPEAYNNIASFMIEKKDYKQAKLALSYAIQLRPHYGKAYFNLGRVFVQEQNMEKAYEAFYHACMKADLDNESGFMGLASCCLQMEKFEEASAVFAKVLEFNPNNFEAAFNIANCEFMLKHYDNAIKAYEQLIRQNPKDAKIWYNLGESYFNADRMMDALNCFERLRHAPAVSPNLFLRIAACYEKLGNPQQAKLTLEQLLRKGLPQEAQQTVQGAIGKLVETYNLA